MGLEIRLDLAEVIGVGRCATTDELAALDEHGFVIVPALLADEDVDLLRTEFERLVAEDAQSRRHELGTRRAQTTRDNYVFAVCWRNRVVLDAAAHILGSTFEVGNVDLRDPSPGYGEQRLHPDHGATRVLPGSHRSGAPRGSEVPIPGEVVAVGASGSLLLRDARLLHAAGRNSTPSHRRSAFVFYQHDIPDDVVGSVQGYATGGPAASHR
jgi:ectoine hydroxylase-related dioxygenase (phytanoyl-CoA dioxygenase family)